MMASGCSWTNLSVRLGSDRLDPETLADRLRLAAVRAVRSDLSLLAERWLISERDKMLCIRRGASLRGPDRCELLSQGLKGSSERRIVLDWLWFDRCDPA